MQAIEEGHQIQIFARKIARCRDFELRVRSRSMLLGMDPRLLNQFGMKVVRRLDMVDGKITPLLDWIRIRSDAVREGVFDLYVNKKLPLVLVGRALGGEQRHQPPLDCDQPVPGDQ